MPSVFLRSDTGMLLKKFIEERDIVESTIAKSKNSRPKNKMCH